LRVLFGILDPEICLFGDFQSFLRKTWVISLWVFAGLPHRDRSLKPKPRICVGES